MIYCVEDDISIRDLMMYTLNTSGYEACGFNDGAEMFAKLAEDGENPELIMLDLMLPGEDGLEILKKLKAGSQTRNIPVIIATAKGTEFDKVIGLDTGADDYLVKPFGMMEMIARVKAVLRRAGQTESDDETEAGGIRISDSTHIVTVDGKPVQLTLKEYELIRLFVRNPMKVFSREALMSEVWGMDYVGETRTVDVHIGTLRTKLGTSGEHIETVRGIGYRFRD